MPLVYDKMGVRFMYPDNWVLDEDDALHGETAVTVYSPGGAFWSLVLHPRFVDPKELAATVLKTIKAEYEDCEAEPAGETVAGHELRGYDLNFYCLDLTNTATIRSFQTGDASCVLLCQAEDREYAEVAPVFEAMTVSLLARRLEAGD